MLVSYELGLRPSMAKLQWVDDLDSLAVSSGMADLEPAQRRIVETWITLINATDKPMHVRRSVPRYAVTHWNLRHHLAQGGYPDLRRPPSLHSLQQTLIAWHSGAADHAAVDTRDQQVGNVSATHPLGDSSEELSSASRRWHLIPLKCFVNHHPKGADQTPVPGKIAVAAATPTGTGETFENYGDLDAFQLLMNFGYLDSDAPLVHSVPVEIESEHLGRVVVRWRAPRNPRGGAIARDVPTLRPTEDGLMLRHLTARPGNRKRVASFLAMAARARAALSPSNARAEAEAMIDAIAQANIDYYRQMDELVVQAAAAPAPPIVEGFGTLDILPTIASLSLLQQQRLSHFWGR